MDTIINLLKKKKRDAADVMQQVYAGVKGDWDKLMKSLEVDESKKLAKPGK